MRFELDPGDANDALDAAFARVREQVSQLGEEVVRGWAAAMGLTLEEWLARFQLRTDLVTESQTDTPAVSVRFRAEPRPQAPPEE